MPSSSKMAAMSAIACIFVLAHVVDCYSISGGLGFSGPLLRVPSKAPVSRIAPLSSGLRTCQSLITSNCNTMVWGGRIARQEKAGGLFMSSSGNVEDGNSDSQAEVSQENAGEQSVDGAADEDGEVMDLNSPEFMKRKIEILSKELAESQQRVMELQADLDPLNDMVKRNLLTKPSAVELKDTYFRLAADMENFRRRSATDLDNAKNAALSNVLKELLTVLDNFELASTNVKTETDKEASIKTSYEAVSKQLLTSLTKLGVEAIDPLGQVFDPNVHNAIQQIESQEYPDGVVCKALVRGYKVGPQVLRAAIVVVSSGPGPAVDASAAPAEATESADSVEI